jgi:catechol 2,3-dioxygenase-like lactoylglutathione lyase family enzyme
LSSAFPCAVPDIPVSDIDAALDYYENRLGFHIDWGAGELGLAGVSRGDCRMFLADPDFRRAYGNKGPILTWLNLGSKDEVNELHRQWTESKATLLSAPESKPWGLHEFTAQDLDGNLFRVFYDFGAAGGIDT